MALKLHNYYTLFFFLLIIPFHTEAQNLGFERFLDKSPDQIIPMCIPNSELNEKTLLNEDITIKHRTTNWLFFNSTARWIDEHYNEGSIDGYYFNDSKPSILADSARAHHMVNQVHQGMAPLGVGYTGTDVIMGVIDTGLDWEHLDFIDSNGNTRVLRYWDHSMSGPVSPAPYGYGQWWDSTAINSGACTSNEELTAHGSSVTGQACGNGLANGTNMGMAPNANIVFVESNFNLANWTLTIADAVDFVFKVADSLDMPAVVNLSLGTYYGSHDGNDPASELMESLLDEKGGRIIVCAAGNAGAMNPWHEGHAVSATDTNFVWLLNNPSGAYGANTIFFDLWTDMADAGWSFAMGADTPGPGYDFRGRSDFHGAMSSMGVPILDTIWNNGNQIATYTAYTETVGSNYHLQMLMSVDSTSYLYRFETTGFGNYDLWSGTGSVLPAFNDLVTAIPTPAEMPDIIYYSMPDSLQSIVSEWNCSEKVVSVANMRNRIGHIDANGNPYYNPATAVGDLSPNSSKGPSRHNLTKPDVTAAGDVSMGAGPLWLLTNPAYNALIDSGGMHVRNGGTSMASPVVAGIAALYLERCRYATYDSFINDIHATSYSDGFTGTTPNNAFGYGKANAFDLLQELTLEPQPTISYNSATTILSSSSSNYQWILDGSDMIGETNQELTPVAPYGSYQVMTINGDGCYNVSDPFVITAGIEETGTQLVKIIPNPTLDEFSIETDGHIKQVVLHDLSGKTIVLVPVSGSHYSLKDLASGTYVLSITTDKQVVQTKIIRL